MKGSATWAQSSVTASEKAREATEKKSVDCEAELKHREGQLAQLVELSEGQKQELLQLGG